MAEGQTYLFEYSTRRKEVHFVIPCPTSPKLYIYRGKSDLEVKLTLVPDLIDRYKFEVEDPKPISVLKGRLQCDHIIVALSVQ